MQKIETLNGKDVKRVVVESDVTPLIDQDTANIKYLGYAPKGTRPDQAKWLILKTTTACTIPTDYPDSALADVGTGESTIEETPDGSVEFNQSWNDRKSLTYRR